MNAPARLHAIGQSLWLDNITRELLDSGTLARYIAELSVTGLTSNPTIYDKAIGGSASYDADVRDGAAKGLASDAILFDLALTDLRRAADLFAPVHARTGGVDGFVSLEVSPRLAYDAEATLAEALRLHRLGARPNLLIKIPGTPEGFAAIEETIFAGVPVNVTLLFSPTQYLACMEAYTRGIERRVEAGLPAYVGSVASFFISRWDTAVASRFSAKLVNQLGLAIGHQAYVQYRSFFSTDRWQRLLNEGARAQRLLFASTGTKDPAASETLYVSGLAAPNTVNTMPEQTLLALAEGGKLGETLAPDAGVAGARLQRFADAGVDVDALAHELQVDGVKAFVTSWATLLGRIEEKLSEVSPNA